MRSHISEKQQLHEQQENSKYINHILISVTLAKNKAIVIHIKIKTISNEENKKQSTK